MSLSSRCETQEQCQRISRRGLSSANRRPPVSLILDTDMGNDIDDVLALAMIHGLEALGECRLLGVTVSKDHPLAPVCVDILNTFYGRGGRPIGMVRDGVTPEQRTFLGHLADAQDNGRTRYPRTRPDGEYPEAVRTLRRLLASQDARSLTVVMIGFSTNMARLLESAPDDVSSLSGLDLFARKVERVVAMAGNFSERALTTPTPETREYNVHRDIPSAKRFFHRCPVPIVFSGYEVGAALPFPAASIERDYGWTQHHPVAEAYRRYMEMPYDRPTWDLTAVLEAVRPGAGYFRRSAPGRVTVSADGDVDFAPDNAGPHQYLILNEAGAPRLLTDMIALCAHRPRDRGGVSHARVAEAAAHPEVSSPATSVQ